MMCSSWCGTKEQAAGDPLGNVQGHLRRISQHPQKRMFFARNGLIRFGQHDPDDLLSGYRVFTEMQCLRLATDGH